MHLVKPWLQFIAPVDTTNDVSGLKIECDE
jgi:hypothetical protein